MRLRLTAWTAVACLAMAHAAVAAQSALSLRLYTHVPAGPLGRALQSLATQRGFQLIYLSAQLRGKKTQGAEGDLSVDGALSQLLRGTGLTYRRLAGDGFSIVPVSAESGASGQRGMPGSSRHARGGAAPGVSAEGRPPRPSVPGRARLDRLQTVIVTAEKRAENIQTVPIAMDVVQGRNLQSQGVTTAGDIVKLFPNISEQGASELNQGVTIRGVGTNDFHLTAQQSVGQDFDGVAAPTPFTSQLGLFDLKRVEVLRGPQNTLFGRNTTGGVIRYISNTAQVGRAANGYLRVGAGNYADVNFTGAYGFPLSDTLAVRVAATVEHRAGIFTNLVNGMKFDSISRQAGRISLEWRPSEATTVLVIAHVGASTGAPPPLRGSGVKLADGVTACPAALGGTNAFIGVNNCFEQTKAGPMNLSTPNWNDVYSSVPPVGSVHDSGGVIRVTHLFQDGIKLTSITGLEHTRAQMASDSVGSPNVQFNVDQDGIYDLVSQELRLTSPSAGRFNWLAGVYLSYEYDDLGTMVINNTVRPVSFPPLVLTTELKQTDRIVSPYGQLNYRLTRRLTASVGGRFSYDDRGGTTTPRTFNDTQNGTLGAAPLSTQTFIDLPFARSIVAGVTTRCALGVGLCNGPGVPQLQITRMPGWNVDLKYKFSRNVMAYVSNSEGFKSGAFDVRAQAVFLGGRLIPVKPEKLNATEVGIKTTLLQHHLRLNADAFHYRWLDEQAFSAIRQGGPAFLNIPLSRIDGAELSAAAAAPGGWTLDAGLGYLDGRIIDAGGLQGVQDGARLSNVPRFTFNSTLGKRFRIGSSRLLQLDASVRFQGEENSSLNNDPAAIVSAATFLDLGAHYTFGSQGQYRLSALAQNVTSTKTCGSNTTLANGILLIQQCLPPNAGVPLYGLSFRMAVGH